MGTFKKCKVVMLPTNEKANIILDRNKLEYINQSQIASTITSIVKGFHLYITSDDKIKEGDWCYHTGRKIVIQFLKQPGYFREYDALKKIIATTDSFLTIESDMNIHSIPTQHIEENKVLPQPSQSFIEKYVGEYNKGNIITDILVEYDEVLGRYSKDIHDTYFVPKVNPKDNNITIKKVKDIWSRDEVIDLLTNHTINLRNKSNDLQYTNKWIHENL